MVLGSRVKELRNKVELTQYQLAEGIGVTVDTIRSIESNRRVPSIEVLTKISDFFDCSIDYLLGKTDDPYASKYTWDSIINIFSKYQDILGDEFMDLLKQQSKRRLTEKELDIMLAAFENMIDEFKNRKPSDNKDE